MKANIYIYQLLGILLLLGGYLFSNTPDSLSEMHFNSNPTTQVVFSKAHKTVKHDHHAPMKVASKNAPKHRSNVVTHISYDVLMPAKFVFTFRPLEQCVSHTCSLIEGYNYLYFLEINPPPPRQGYGASIA